MKRLILIASLLAMSACAASPDSIQPAYVSPVAYNAYDCDQLGAEEARLQSALSAVSKEQRDARSGDAWGVALLGLPVSSFSGKNVASQVAQVKGNINAVQEAQTIKKCTKKMETNSASPSVQ